MLQTIAQTIVSCLKSAHARGAVREPLGGVIDWRFDLVATFCFDDFHDTIFFTKKRKSLQKSDQK